MIKRNALIGMAVGALALGGFTAWVLPAGAEQHTLVVTLADGKTVVVTVDSSSGGSPQLPNLGAKVVGVTDVTAPSNTTTTNPTQQPISKGQPTKQPTKKHPGTKKHPKNPKQPAQPTLTGGQAQPLVRKHHKQVHGTRIRQPNGTPTSANPGFSLSVPGPAAIGVPNFFIEKFRIPPFLLPIYQAAGIQYNIPWQILAAINEIETDYGRNLSVSSANAVGWMQFLPSTWKEWGVDANNDKRKDPYNPVDAIFAAARYLRAAGGEKDIKRAIFAYNHADWYVQSVLLRARLIGGLPADLVGSLTGLTQGHFPIAARSTYADDVTERNALKRVHRGNAAVTVNSTNRTSINIYSHRGAPVVAVNDGVVRAIGHNAKLGRYLVLQDVYGNRYTYAHLGKVAPSYPEPKPVPVSAKSIRRELEVPAKDSKPKAPASAGRQVAPAPSPSKKRSAPKKLRVAATPTVTKERLFAHPARPSAYSHGGDQQLLSQGKPVAGYSTFEAYFTKVLGLHSKDVVLKPMRPGVHVVAGTILGRIDKTVPNLAPHLMFEIQPAGKNAPHIDPKPILDGWKLLETTAIYRAAGKNPFLGGGPSIGQILLMSKNQLEGRVLADPGLSIYSCGRRDIRSGQIDSRVLATMEFLRLSGFKLTITSLRCGHSFLTTSGNVSEHTTGDAMDIAAVNGIPILGHQGKGSITELVIRRLLTLQGRMKPHQIISLMSFKGADNTMVLPDHANHIHVGFHPLYGANGKLAKQINATLKPGQWIKLIDRLNNIDEPVVPVRPSKYSIAVKPGSSKNGE